MQTWLPGRRPRRAGWRRSCPSRSAKGGGARAPVVGMSTHPPAAEVQAPHWSICDTNSTAPQMSIANAYPCFTAARVGKYLCFSQLPHRPAHLHVVWCQVLLGHRPGGGRANALQQPDEGAPPRAAGGAWVAPPAAQHRGLRVGSTKTSGAMHPPKPLSRATGDVPWPCWQCMCNPLACQLVRACLPRDPALPARAAPRRSSPARWRGRRSSRRGW